MRNEKLVEATMLALQGKLEARNPENDEINTKIRKSLNDSTKYIGDLEDAGLEVSQNDNGKVYRIGKTVKDDNGNKDYIASRGMDKQDLKNSHPDTDYYNYMTKKRVAPEVTDTGAFTPTNPFRNSDSFEKTVSTSDRTVYQSDENGVSKAIPKKYKTGRRNTHYNPDEFPEKDYTGVASYEPLDNQELKDFKYNKSKVSDDGWLKRDLDKAKAEYDRVKADYDKVNDQVQGVRDRIAKSKANRKAHGKITRENKKVTEAIDEDKTKVIFRKELEDGDIIAVFPEDKQGNDMIGCYAHMGQHSTMSLDYYKETVPATPEEYKDLKAELENIVGYNLEVVTELDENKKVTEATTGDTKRFTLQVSCGKDDAIITLDINKNASFDDVIKTLKNELYDFPKNFNKK